MKMAIFTIFMSLICSFLLLWQTDNHVSSTAYYKLKNTLDVATHDASLQIDMNSLNQGIIKFNAARANDALLNSLKANLKLDSSSHPIEPNIFRSTDKLEYKMMTVDTGCPGKPSGFPCVFDAWAASDGYIDTLEGPSVVAIVKMRHPRPFGISRDKYYIVGSSHEYKGF